MNQNLDPRGGWWGEGDEKFFMDGEKFPSTTGTGSEDYFGYAWCCPQLFENAYHNQPLNDGNNCGHVAVNRWHITDNVSFQKSFEGCIEKYYSNQRPTLYAATAYWYLAPGGNPHEQDLTGFLGQWSNDAHLWWIGTKPGDKLDLALPVKKTGKYQLCAQLTKGPDYGIAQLYLDGVKIGGPIDLYSKSVKATGLLALGTHDLAAGDHKLTVEIVGTNEKAIKSYMFGLDYVKLDPQ